MRWLIPSSPSRRTDPETREYWETSHGNLDYQDVFSVTEDEGLLRRLTDAVATSAAGSPTSVLVPGCGSRTLLERHLVGRFPSLRVVSTDFERVVTVAAEQFPHPQVQFIARDTRNLGFRSTFDAAIIVNSILSDHDEDNRLMISSVKEAIRPGGQLIGLFPTVFATVDLAYCEPDQRWRLRLVDLETSRYHEETQNQSQIFYTPLRLRAMLREVEFVDIRMDIFFCDSPELRSEAERVYGLRGEDAVLYELVVTAKVPASKT